MGGRGEGAWERVEKGRGGPRGNYCLELEVHCIKASEAAKNTKDTLNQKHFLIEL
jgi:hypothetical protein